MSSMIVVTVSNFRASIYIVFYIIGGANCYLRYTEQSCTDLTPRSYDDYTNREKLFTSSSTSRFNDRGKWRRDNSYSNEIPFKIRATGRRYRRDTDVIVQIEGGSFDGLMLQARRQGGTNFENYRKRRSGSNGGNSAEVVGYFPYLKFPFKHIVCFDLPTSTIVDEGKPVRLGNVSFVWRSPEQDVGDIRFIASILQGIKYWVIVSNTLTFNPFPISRYLCGSTRSCFRLCPLDIPECIPKEAIYVMAYQVDTQEKREVEFTLGGYLRKNNSYIAVGFGENYENLRQADVMACYLDRGRARVEHLLIDGFQLPPYEHQEPIEVDDYDLDGRVLWCRFRRPLSSIDITKEYYHFYFWGTIDFYLNNRFMLPTSRLEIYTSGFKRNLTVPINEIRASSTKLFVNKLIFFSISIVLICPYFIYYKST